MRGIVFGQPLSFYGVWQGVFFGIPYHFPVFWSIFYNGPPEELLAVMWRLHGIPHIWWLPEMCIYTSLDVHMYTHICIICVKREREREREREKERLAHVQLAEN